MQVLTDGLTVGSGAGAAYVRGRMGPEQMQLGDIDLELIAAVPLKFAAYINVFGRSLSPHLHAISNGVLTEYAALQAFELGQEHRDQDAATQGRARAVRGIGPGTVSPIGQQRQAVR